MSQEEVEEVLIIEWEKNPKGKKTKPQSIYDSRIYRKRTRKEVACLLVFFSPFFPSTLYNIRRPHDQEKRKWRPCAVCKGAWPLCMCDLYAPKSSHYIHFGLQENCAVYDITSLAHVLLYSTNTFQFK
jgi:hypothetical protein